MISNKKEWYQSSKDWNINVVPIIFIIERYNQYLKILHTFLYNKMQSNERVTSKMFSYNLLLNRLVVYVYVN